jgi:DNA-directed RNA polymerase subunit E'/Rpb7
MKTSQRGTSQRQQQHSHVGRKNNAPSGGLGELSLFDRAIMERQVAVHITNVGKNLTQTLERVVKKQYEGRCTVEGFIKPGSVSIRSYSAGKAIGDNVCFTVVFECQVCHPVEDMVIQCIARNVTKAGIRAESIVAPSPVVVFVTRDHNYGSEYFSSISEGDHINIKVIGQRFELYDDHISIVAQLVEPSVPGHQQGGERDSDKIQRITIEGM